MKNNGNFENKKLHIEKSFCYSREENQKLFLSQIVVTRSQLAQALAISESFISKLMLEEGLPYIKLGRSVRFDISEVTAWLQKRRMP